MKIHEQYQNYNGKKYTVSQIIHMADDLPVEEVDIRLIGKYHELISEESYDIVDFVDEIKRIQ